MSAESKAAQIGQPELEDMIKNNERLIYFVLHKYYPSLVHDEDAFQIGRIGLWQACESYDENQGSLSTYAVKCIRNAISNEMRQIRKAMSIECVSLDSPMPHIGDGTIAMKEGILDPTNYFDDVEYQIDELRPKIPERDLTMLTMKASGYTYKEIGEQFGVTKQRAQQILKKAGTIVQDHYGLSL